MDQSRREFLRAGLAAGALESICVHDAALGSPRSSDASSDAMGVLVDLTKCNGCRRCEAACRRANGFDVLTDDELKDRSVFTQNRYPGPRDYTVINEFHVNGTNPNGQSVYVKRNCMHCNAPACASACLVGALRKQPNGAVTYDPYKCMGCRYCMVVCPFQIPAYDYHNAFTPQVRKCTFCTDRKDAPGESVPACVRACPKECLSYAKRNELIQTAHARIAERPDIYVDHVFGEHEAGGTSWLFLSPVPFERIGFPRVALEAPSRLSESVQHAVFAYSMPPLAWCAILALAMWITKPEEKEADGRPAGRAESPTFGRSEPLPRKTRTTNNDQEPETCSASA